MNILFYLLPKNKVDYLFSDFTVRQAVEKMKEKRFLMLPIIDKKNGKYLKTIQFYDFLDYLSIHQLSFQDLEMDLLSDIPCSKNIRPVGINCDVQELYKIIGDQNFVPVVDDEGIFIGIVTRKAVMEEIIKEHLAAKKE
jgi:CBS domain-containing protein